MVDLNDEVLIAYADGELDDRTAAEVEAALENDPLAREIVQRFQEAGQLATDAFAAPMDEEVPERLLKLFEETDADYGTQNGTTSEAPAVPSAHAAPSAPASAHAPADGNVADLSQHRATQQPKSHTFATASGGQDNIRRFALPLAASVALLIGIGGGVGLSNFTSPSAPSVVVAGTIPEESLLHAALENTPSLESLEEVSEDGLTRNQIEPQLTFVGAGDRYCREYRIIGRTMTGTQDLNGVACRGDDGAWTQQIAVTQEISSGAGYRPASKADTALEGFMTDFMKDEPLDDAAERRLLKSDWR